MSRRAKVLISIGIGAVSTVAIVLKFWKPLGGRIAGARLARVQHSPHWSDGRFRNLIPTKKGEFLRSIVRAFQGKQERTPLRPIPIHALHAQDLADVADLRAVWIGHSSTIVDVDGVRFLTDPVWSERCSPSQTVGPKRFHPPPIALADTGRVDAVVISHDHYDHLDMATVQGLAPRGVTFFVPLGIGAHLERWGIPLSQIRELDWNESAELRGVRFMALPARHYSGRSVHIDETEWASWAVIGPRHRVFFSGDTGYFDEFKRIGDTLGPFDLTLVKIGAYDETWPEIHMNPEEAVKTHLAVRGKLMLPVHWGTFNLAYHDWFEPVERMLKAADGRIATTTPRPGDIVTATNPPATRWWR